MIATSSPLDAPGVLEGIVSAWPSLKRVDQLLLAREHPVFWAMHASEGRWKPARHLLYLARRLMRLMTGESRRLIVSMPPRHGKTAFVWRLFGAWRLGARPREKVMAITYQARQACRWSKQARDDLATFGPEVFGVGASKRAAAEEWQVLRNGVPTEGLMNALGLEGALTGKGGDCLIVDDYVSGVDAIRNPVIRDQAFERMDQDVLSRFEKPESSAIIIGTRWHEDDIIGRILKLQDEGLPPGGYEWEVINLPLLALEDDALGRKPGEALWPERWTQEWAEKKRDTAPDPFSFEALFQGRPKRKSGNLFKIEQVQYYEEQGAEFVSPGARTSAAHLVLFATVDPAFSTKTSADYLAIGVWGYDPLRDRLFLLELFRGRLAPEDAGPKLRAMMEFWKCTRVYVERHGFKNDQVQEIKKHSGITAAWREIQPNEDKVARAMPAADYMATGRLLFRARAPWLPVLIDELTAFPASEKDDQADVVSFGVHVASTILKGRDASPPEIPPGRGPDLPGGGLIPRLVRPGR